MSPAKKFRPVSWTFASSSDRAKSSISLSDGVVVGNGHQNSTAEEPARATAAGRSSTGRSVSMIEAFTVYRTVVPPRGGGAAAPFSYALIPWSEIRVLVNEKVIDRV